MPFDAVGLTGGVFQNKLLAELAMQQLAAAGFEAYLPQQAPCNDGGLALGQLIEATASEADVLWTNGGPIDLWMTHI